MAKTLLSAPLSPDAFVQSGPGTRREVAENRPETIRKPSENPSGELEGRMLRRTARDFQFAVKTTHAVANRIYALARIENLRIVEVIELAIDALEEKLARKKGR